MARYIGPTCKFTRSDKFVFLKSGKQSAEKKCREHPAGQHGSKQVRKTDYGKQLFAKQSLKRIYGVLERQFRNYYLKASKMKGSTGEILLQMLERRLDNVVYRMGFASTRAEARQMVSHAAVLVNGRRVNIPSFFVSAGDVVCLTEKAKGQPRVKASLEMNRPIPEWMDVDLTKCSGTFKFVPDRSYLPAEYNEQLVVELYSK